MFIRSLLLSALLLVAVAPVCAQDWAAVARLRSGTRVYLNERGGDELKGKVASVSDRTVELRVNGGVVSVAKDNVLTIHLARRGSRLKRAFIGAAAGAGIGAGVGAGVAAATKSDGLAAAAGFLYGIPVGAVVGAVTAGHKRGELIYSSN
jgi:hypothetical protein